MKYLKTVILAIIAIVLITAPVLASDVSNALWHGIIRVSNAGASNVASLATNMTLNSGDFISNGYANTSLDDVAIQINSVDTPFMPGYDNSPWAIWVPEINLLQNIDYDFYSSNATGGEIRYFPASGGMATSDSPGLEIGDNFTIEQSGWVDTDNATSKYLVFKEAAFATFISPTTSENITSEIYEAGVATDVYLLPSADGDYTELSPGTNDYLKVDDPVATPDDATTTVYTVSATQKKDAYEIDDLDANMWLVNYVTVYFRIDANGGAGAGVQAQPFLRLGSNETAGTAIQVPTSFTTYSENLTRPGGGTWTHEDINDLQIAIGLKDDPASGYYPSCTQIYAKVNYTPAAAAYSVSATGVTSGEHSVNTTAYAATGFVTPTSHNDPLTLWTYDTNTYDDNTGTSGYTDTKTAYLELTPPQITYSDRIRIFARDETIGVGYYDPNLNIDVYYDDAWHNIWSGVITKDVWVTKTFTGNVISAARVNFANSTRNRHYIYELDFYGTSGMAIYIDDALEDVISTDNTSVPDNSSDWTFLQNSAMPYMEYHEFTINGTQQQYIEWEYGTTFTDASGKGNDATPTFRTTTDDANVTAVLLSFSPTSEAELASFSLTSLTDILTDTPTAIDQLYTELDFTYVPGADVINEMLTAGDIPQALWWFPFIFIGICITGMLTYGATRLNGGTGSILTMVIVMEVLLALGGLVNPIPFWPAMLFPIAAGAIVISQKHWSWG